MNVPTLRLCGDRYGYCSACSYWSTVDSTAVSACLITPVLSTMLIVDSMRCPSSRQAPATACGSQVLMQPIQSVSSWSSSDRARRQACLIARLNEGEHSSVCWALSSKTRDHGWDSESDGSEPMSLHVPPLQAKTLHLARLQSINSFWRVMQVVQPQSDRVV